MICKTLNQLGKIMKIIIITIFIYIFYTINALSENPPQTKLYAVIDGSCCGGEESDPHAVHGIEVLNNGFILSGKSIDIEGNVTLNKGPLL